MTERQVSGCNKNKHEESLVSKAPSMTPPKMFKLFESIKNNRIADGLVAGHIRAGCELGHPAIGDGGLTERAGLAS
jgi:hypothetical protein